VVTRKDVLMPAPHPAEFRHRAVQLARQGASPVSKIARDLGISESCLRNWMHQADADENPGADRLSGGEKKELAELRRRSRLLEMENEILKRAAAYFARENVLPK
jgi:transposase